MKGAKEFITLAIFFVMTSYLNFVYAEWVTGNYYGYFTELYTVVFDILYIALVAVGFIDVIEWLKVCKSRENGRNDASASQKRGVFIV